MRNTVESYLIKSGKHKESFCETAVFSHLYKQRHVWLLHGLYARLHQRDAHLQVIAVLTDERLNMFELFILFFGDETHQLLLPLLQDGHQTFKVAAQVFSLPLAVFLKNDGVTVLVIF